MDGIKAFATNRLTWVSIAYVVLFTMFTRLAGITTTAEVTRAATTALGLIGMVTYGDAAVRAYRARRWPNPNLIAALGMFLIMVGIGVGGLFQILWRLSDFERYVVSNHAYSLIVSLSGAGIFILVAVPNIIGIGVPAWTRARILTAWAIAVALVMWLVLASPDLRWLAEKLKPWLLWGVSQ